MPTSLKILYTCLFGILSLTLSAQEADSITTNVPEAIPLIELSSETQETRQKISRANERILTDSNIQEITEEFEQARQEFDEAIEDYQTFRSVTPNKLKLNNYIRKWRAFGDARVRWRNSLSSYMSRADLAKQSLDFEVERWQLTRNQALELDASDEVINSIDNTIIRINSQLDEINGQLDLALTISTVVAEQQSEIDEIIADLVAWSSSGELNTFYQRHPPIWKTEFDLFDRTSRTKLQTAGDHAHAINDYYRNFGWQANIYLIITLLIVAFIFYLERRVKNMEFDDRDDSMVRVRSVIEKHTLTAAFYFASVFALFYLENLPAIVSGVFMFAVLICSSILLRPFIMPKFKWLIFFIIIAFVFDVVKSYVWFSSAGYRLYMYTEAFYVLIIGLFYVRYVGLKDLKQTTINTVFKIGVSLVIAVSLGSVIANTLGYTNLSDVLLRVVIMGPAITVLAYGILFVLGGVVGTSLSIYFVEHPELDASASSAILSKTQAIVKWTAAAIWVIFILVSAELYRPLFSALELWLTEPWIFGEFSLTPSALLSFVFVIIVAFIITRAIATLIDGGVLDFIRIPKGTLAIISMVIRYFIVALAIAIALGTVGIDLSKFGLVAGALGVGIGFGLQNIVANFISGMILTFEQPASPGDTIEVNGLMGIVQKIGVRSSMIRSFDGADIIIPNSTLLSNDLVNWTRVDDQKRIEIHIGAAYGSNPNQVREVLLKVVHDHPNVLTKPEPSALFSQFGDSSLNFRLLFWAPIGDWLAIQSEVASDVYDKFAENGIEIPFPQQDVWIREGKSGKSKDSAPSSDDGE